MHRNHVARGAKTLPGGVSRLISLVAVALLTLVAPAAIAASGPVEQILDIVRIGQPQGDLVLIESRLIFPPGAQWAFDPDAGPLTLAVEHGKVGVFLGGGLARIERQSTPLQERRIHPLETDRMAFLQPGDRLVVIRGYQLQVENDEEGVAAITVSRLSREWDLAVTTGNQLGKPR